MEGFGKEGSLRLFSNLNPVERVRAILACVEEPVTRRQALKFAKLVWDNLDLEEKKEIDRVFEQSLVGSTHCNCKPEETLSELRVDKQSVHRAIAESVSIDWSMIKQRKRQEG